MPQKDRELLLKINQQILKLQEAPAPTFAPQTGEVEPETEYHPISLPEVKLPSTQTEG